MNILIITAHPSPTGFTHRIASAYQERDVGLGHTVEILDLYKSPRQDYFTFEPKSTSELEIQKAYQDKISCADELVFIHPMWWGSMPAIMKNWLDVNFAGGFSHTFKNGHPVALLKGKRAKVFITSDGKEILYWILLKPYAIIWTFVTLGFVGIKVDCVKLFGNKRNRTEVENLEFLEKVRGKVR
jgi:NAD(P)H dehydrogenase (quinone)